nr:immunoglobulin heavy chain junction region [Mus musculus]MBK4183800.1 immunoglobulin heavy chain junction region [Mus musculus]MBK4183802.1 immunoglobulin heavy chain junction region [Mus musculus]
CARYDDYDDAMDYW